MDTIRRFGRAFAWLGLVLWLGAAGCGNRQSTDTDPGSGAAPGAGSSGSAPLSKADQAVYQRLEAEVNTIVNDQTLRFATLQYKYSENLLEILDQIDLVLSGKHTGEPPRFLPKLSAQEEQDHLRDTVRRWEAETGKSLRTEVDMLKADVAARRPGEAFHPEFQRKFSQVFDRFIAIEVAEMRERRNRAIHAAAESLLAPFRADHPEPVRRIQELLDRPPYNLPTPAPSEAVGRAV